jgi:hypothetical protein
MIQKQNHHGDSFLVFFTFVEIGLVGASCKLSDLILWCLVYFNELEAIKSIPELAKRFGMCTTG